MQVSKMMRTSVVTVSPDTPFRELLRMQACMASRQIHVVDESRKMLGIITSYDLLNALAPFYIDSNLARALPDDVSVIRHAYEASKGKTAGDIMTPVVAALKPTDHFVEAETLIREKGGNVLPVVDDEGCLLGEITRKTIVKYLALDVLGVSCEGKEG